MHIDHAALGERDERVGAPAVPLPGEHVRDAAGWCRRCGRPHTAAQWELIAVGAAAESAR